MKIINNKVGERSYPVEDRPALNKTEVRKPSN